MKTLKVTDAEYKKIKELLKTTAEPVRDLSDLIGQVYVFYCTRYIYHGKVKAVNNLFITLEDVSIVYDTGEHTASSPADMQALPNDLNILIHSMENFTKMNW